MNKSFQNIIISTAIIVYFLILNYLQPIAMDDYWRILNDTIVNHNLLAMLKQDYIGWTGRMSAQILVYVIFSKKYLVESTFFINTVNTIALYSFTIITFKICTKDKYQINSKIFAIYLLFFTLMFTYTGFLGQVLWKTAAIQYFWGLCIVTILYYYTIIKNKQLFYTGLIIGFFIGLYNEQFVGVLLLFCFAYFVESILNKKHINKSIIAFAIGCLLGGVILISAPGNYARMDSMNGNTHTITEQIMHLIYAFRYTSWPNTKIIVLLFILFFYLAIKNKNTQKKTLFIYGSTLILSIFVMTPIVYSYGIQIRPMLIYYIIFFIIVMDQFFNADIKILKKTISLLNRVIILLLLALLYIMSLLLINYYSLYQVSQKQDKIMLIAKSQNNKKIELPVFDKINQQNRYGTMSRSITCNPKDPNNQAFAKFYNISSVTANDC